MTLGALAPGVVDQNAAHGFGSGGEKMGAAIPLLVFVADEPQPGFMHQRGGLQRLSGCFVRHLRRRQLAQLLIDQREQIPGGLLVAVLDRVEDLRDVAHRPSIAGERPVSLMQKLVRFTVCGGGRTYFRSATAR